MAHIRKYHYYSYVEKMVRHESFPFVFMWVLFCLMTLGGALVFYQSIWRVELLLATPEEATFKIVTRLLVSYLLITIFMVAHVYLFRSVYWRHVENLFRVKKKSLSACHRRHRP